MLAIIGRGTDARCEEVQALLGLMLEGKTSDAQNARFLSGMAAKGETDEELACMLEVMMAKAVSVRPRSKTPPIDVCGTGGDMQQTFNVSTAAAFVAAAAGCTVAKHGNRSTSGVCGSADIFESVGYDIRAGPPRVAEILEEHGICFMFAQRFHPAMRHVAPARRMVGGRTAFNLLGPLANPAGVTRQLVGVSSADLLYRIPRILLKRGAAKVVTVMSADGMDELSTSSANTMLTVMAAWEGEGAGGGDSKEKGGRGAIIAPQEAVVRPEDVGLHRSERHEIRVGSRQEALKAFVDALDGASGRRAMCETAALNAAAALLVADKADDLAGAVETCIDAIDSGRASAKLDGFVADCGDALLLEEIRSG